MLLATSTPLTQLTYTVQYSPIEVYYRDLLISSNSESKNIYGVDANSFQVVQLIMSLQDNSLTCTSPKIHITKMIGEVSATITERPFDAESKALVYLVNGQQYAVTVTCANGVTRSIGNLLVDSTNLQKTIVIGSTSTVNASDYGTSSSLTFDNSTGVITYTWHDPAGNTNGVHVSIVNRTNTSQIFYECDSANATDSSCSFAVPDVNGTYAVITSIDHDKFGNMTSSTPFGGIVGAFIGNVTQNIYASFSEAFSYDQVSQGVTAISAMFLMILPMTFGPVLGGVAAIIVGLFAAILHMFGMFPVSIGLIAVVVVLAIMARFADRRHEQ
jgi:hypothetical protein